MTLPEKIAHIREHCFQDLDSWEKNFIDDIHETVIDLGDNPSEEDVLEFLTTRQIDKVNEIWGNLGL